jgi:hypothetical protein
MPARPGAAGARDRLGCAPHDLAGAASGRGAHDPPSAEPKRNFRGRTDDLGETPPLRKCGLHNLSEAPCGFALHGIVTAVRNGGKKDRPSRMGHLHRASGRVLSVSIGDVTELDSNDNRAKN